MYQYLKDRNNLEEYELYLKGEITRDELYAKVPEHVRSAVIHNKISDEKNKDIFRQIDTLKNGKDIDLIIGGPPCQAYSIMGRAVDKNNKELDERNYLYIQYARFLKRYSPKVFVFENVKGLISAGASSYLRNMTKYFRRIGYETDMKLLNAVNFGVLQNRERVIIIGWKKGMKFDYPKFKTVEHDYFVSDAFSDLPFVSAGKGQNKNGDYKTPKAGYLLEFGIRNGIDILTQHIARPHIERDLQIYREVVLLWNAENRRMNYNELSEELITHKNLSGFQDRFKVVASNQKFSQTVVAHIAKDGHHYIHPSIKQNRSLTVREAARLQSFPDDYYFEGVKENKNRTAAFKQIGNAVPPLMAYAIGKKIKELCL